MRTTRRTFLRTAGAGAVAVRFGGGRMGDVQHDAYDVAVVGAGVFGSWSALELRERGLRVALIDAYGPGSSRASSGGESRVIRMGYGPDEIYTRSSMRSLERWTAFFEQVGRPLFHKTGVLWMAEGNDPITTKSLETLKKVGVPHEVLRRGELEARYPQINLGPITWAIYEPGSGVLMARRAVQAVVEEAVRHGVDFIPGAVMPPTGRGRLESIECGTATIRAGTYVFACGPWLGKVFPSVLGERIFPTRQEVFYFGTPPGDTRFQPGAMPVWIDFGAEVYGMPDIESKGFKVAPDRHGPAFDPDTGERLVTEKTLAETRAFVADRFPGLAKAPVVATEVCQYENTSNGDFLVDRHPDFGNVWLVGGGSGHGFKHGPVMGEYVAAAVTGTGAPEPRFALATKAATQNRSVH
jgi:monomeric sarcosine oxidase